MVPTLQDMTQSTQVCLLCWLWSVAWIRGLKRWNSTQSN